MKTLSPRTPPTAKECGLPWGQVVKPQSWPWSASRPSRPSFSFQLSIAGTAHDWTDRANHPYLEESSGLDGPELGADPPDRVEGGV